MFRTLAGSVYRSAALNARANNTSIGLRCIVDIPDKANEGSKEIQEARAWLSNLNPETIPKSICEVTYSRSSGPGGQNVNKVNSKATLRVPLEHLLPVVPPLLHDPIRSSRYYARQSDSLLIQADDSRKQSDNAMACFRKLNELLHESAKEVVPGETSPEKIQHVKELQKEENERRLQRKHQHSSKKSARKGGNGADY